MEVYVSTDMDQYITGYRTSNQYDSTIKVIQDDPVIDISKLPGYKVERKEDGLDHLVFDSEKWAEIVAAQEKEMAIENGNVMLNKAIKENILSTASDEDAYVMRYMYPSWDGNGIEYKKDERLIYNDKFYKVLQDHTSQSGWTPDTASSLYVEISDPNLEYPEFKQPTMAENAYNTGDKVSYNGKKYVSKIDNNVWSPDAYPAAWEEVTD